MDRPTGDFKHPCTIVECSSQIASLVDGEGGVGGGGGQIAFTSCCPHQQSESTVS